MRIFIVEDEAREEYAPVLPEDLRALFLADELLLIAAADETDGTVRGVLAADISDEEWDIVWLYVDEDYRRQGIASGMISLLTELMPVLFASRIEAAYSRRGETPESLDAFFDAIGAEVTETDDLYRTTVKSVCESVPEKAGSAGGSVVPLSELPSYEWDEVKKRIYERAEAQEPQDAEDDPPLFLDPGEPSSYDGDVSLVCITGERHPLGVVLLSEREGGIVLDYLTLLQNGTASKTALIDMIGSAAKKAEKKYGADASFFVNPVNKGSKKLFDKLCGGESELFARSVVRRVA